MNKPALNAGFLIDWIPDNCYAISGMTLPANLIKLSKLQYIAGLITVLNSVIFLHMHDLVVMPVLTGIQ